MAFKDTRSESEKRMNAIEREHFGRCLWQLKFDNGLVLVECLDHPKARSTVIVVKHYASPIRDGKPWPKMVASYVYAALDHSNTWEGLEQALTALEMKPTA